MPKTIQAPQRSGPTVKTGPRLFRKQVLKFGTISYPGVGKLTFDKPYADKVTAAFNQRAYDQVPFILADADNRHHMRPEAFRGQVVGLQTTDDGLDALLELTEDGAKLIDDNPSLGVSGRFVQDMARADGQTFPVAMQHVLGTFDPRLTGLRPWEQLTDLSTDPSEVVDLTAATYEGEPMTDEELAKIADLVAAKLKPADDTPSESETPDATGDLTAEEEAELKAILEAADDEPEPPEAQPETAPEPALALSQPVDLAGADPARVQALEEVLGTERYDAWAKDMARAGVPPRILDLARPVLSKFGALTIDLANSDTTEPSAIIRQMLEEAKGVIDMSRAVGTTDGADSMPAEKTQQAVNAWKSEYFKSGPVAPTV